MIGNYVVLGQLGAGMYGSVYKAYPINNPTQTVAIKLVNHKGEESNVLSKCKHPNIVKLYETMRRTDCADGEAMVMECLHGDLLDLVADNNRLSENQCRTMLLPILSALNYMHQSGFVHRDIKLENILLDANMQPKLADFGFAAQWSETNRFTNLCGSQHYVAPEVLQRMPYKGPEVDIWAFGVLMYALTTRTMPFQGSGDGLYKKILAAEYTLPSFLSRSLQDLLARIFNPNVEQRITLEQIIRHPWFQTRTATTSSSASSRSTTYHACKSNHAQPAPRMAIAALVSM